MKKFVYCCLFVFAVTSCTNITVRNQPGKPEKEFPAFMQGDFEVVFPESMNSMMVDADSSEAAPTMKIKITNNAFVTITDEGSNVNIINDSTSVCIVKGAVYLCMGRAPEFNIFKVEDKQSFINIYPMFVMGEVSESDLKKYFTDIQKDPSNELNYFVTVNPKKLKAFFEGPLPYKDPFVLKRIN